MSENRFEKIDLNKFEYFISNVNLTRSIKEIHIHHTWRPDYDDYYRLVEDNPNQVYKMIEGMRNYHVNTRGWQDIGQHLTIDPDGGIWICRDINISPASIKHHNEGAYAIENIGNFDCQKDQLSQIQWNTLAEVCKILTKKFGLNANTESIIYHNQFSSKTCPGSCFPNKSKLIDQIKDIQTFNTSTFSMFEYGHRGKNREKVTIRVLKRI